MTSVNNSQVQSTNDASTASKCSAAAKNYFQDNFICHFVDKKKPRASLINLGYYTRAIILFRLIEKYIKFLRTKNIYKFQIVSCGAGFDTSYWRLSEVKLLTVDSIFIEIDFPNVVRKKISIINQSTELKSWTMERLENDEKLNSCVHVMASNYYLLEADLSDLKTLESLFALINVDFNIPTLFLSECVITYMKESSSNNLIKWIAEKFENSCFINYEQIHPDDGFGKIMLMHFEKLQSTLYSVIHYPDCSAHCMRYKKLGFETVCATSEWDRFVSLTTPAERDTAFGLELFDEFEEFHNKCVHYVVGIAGNGLASEWMNHLPVAEFNFSECAKNTLRLEKMFKNGLELYRHCSFSLNNKCVYLIGGCSKHKRSSKIHKICIENGMNVNTIQVNGCENVQLDIVYGSVSHFKLNKMNYCCLYGGRTSPDSVCNSGAVLIFHIQDDNWTLKHIIQEGNPFSRYRSSMTAWSNDENNVYIWIFGGRSPISSDILSDLSLLKISSGENGVLTHKWKTYKRAERWPAARMSHSLVACPKSGSLFVSCGLKSDSFEVLNDIWKWSLSTDSWTQLELNGQIVPRYGHTSHFRDNKLFFIGGVNTLSGSQPGLAIINLDNLVATEFTFEVLDPEPVLLFNHSSEMVEMNGKLRLLILGGGGNCFSFGTYLNKGVYCVPLEKVGERKLRT